MRTARIALLLILLTGLTIAQTAATGPAANQPQDIFGVARADRSLAMFMTAIQSSGMARSLLDEGPLTVFALSNRAFFNLPKEQRESLLTDRAALHFLMTHYIVHGSIARGDAADMLSARTLMGGKLRTDIRSEGLYINGAKLSQPAIQCVNGMIYVLDSFDPGLVHDAIAFSRTDQRGK